MANSTLADAHANSFFNAVGLAVDRKLAVPQMQQLFAKDLRAKELFLAGARVLVTPGGAATVDQALDAMKYITAAASFIIDAGRGNPFARTAAAFRRRG